MFLDSFLCYVVTVDVPVFVGNLDLSALVVPVFVHVQIKEYRYQR